MKSLRIRTALLTTALTASLALAPAAAPAATLEPAGDAGAGATPVIATLVPQKQIVPVRGSDGRYHAMYELLLTNTVSRAAKLKSVTVLDAASDRRVLRIGAKEMVAGDLHMLDRNPVKDTSVPAGQARVLFVSVAFESKRAIPRRLAQRFELSGFNPFTLKTERFRYDAGTVDVSRRPAPVLAPPLDGGSWLASDGCCTAAGHVSAIYALGGKLQAAERYAVDWIKVAADGRVFHGDPSMLASWAGYGVPVRSASAGVVIEARDDLPDQTPLVKPGTLPFEDLPGNVVVVRMKNGLSAVYAHLVPGSVMVKAGDRVGAGQQLGRLGNSGGSLAPHLHFHVVNGTAAGTSDGYPFEIDSFRLGAVSDVAALGEALQGRPGFPTAAQMKPKLHRDELPLGFALVEFPG